MDTLAARVLCVAVLATILSLAVLSSPLYARTIFVNCTRPGNEGDGLTWATARKTVQAGLNSATSGDQVWVARGTYLERITLGDGVAVYGGFVGTESDLSQRPAFPRPPSDPDEAILDGYRGGSVVTSPPGATAATRLDGFTIRNGSDAGAHGGGICCESSSPTISNNLIKENTAGMGGGILCVLSSPTITNNIIAANVGNYGGGGICCAQFSSPFISGNTIIGNHGSYGGGINCDRSSPTVSSNRITANLAGSGGGVLCQNAASPILSSNAILGNIAVWDSAVCCNGSSPTISNNTIAGNGGGGIDCGSSSPSVSNNIVAMNAWGIRSSGGVPVLQNNDVYNPGGDDYSGLDAGVGDRSVDPRLTGLQYGSCRIHRESLCRNAGFSGAPGVGSTDIDGQPRDDGGGVDIGADESYGEDPATVSVVVRVDGTNGSDSNSGSSWALAKRTVRSAIEAACGTGGEVWVMAGTYHERVKLEPYAHVYGGFSGTETARDGRNWTANPTILDGGGGGSVVTASYIGNRTSTIDGFTIRNGKSQDGAGVYCSWCSPTISNNVIRENSAAGGQGGGLLCTGAAPDVSGNAVAQNSSAYGGGIFIELGSPSICGNAIVRNSATYGAAIYCRSSC
ncbi:MAG TPA: right-handed parallel beta-helix repeat-containing protein, partial [Chloroflexota bacterium]|nr:right-handed parallel beta-helix repeat-containing protein [Chloroflexota bacterium]